MSLDRTDPGDASPHRVLDHTPARERKRKAEGEEEKEERASRQKVSGTPLRWGPSPTGEWVLPPPVVSYCWCDHRHHGLQHRARRWNPRYCDPESPWRPDISQQ